MSIRTLGVIAASVVWLLPLTSQPGACQANPGPPTIVTATRLFEESEALFVQTLLGHWADSQGYDVGLERRFPRNPEAKEYSVTIHTSGDPSSGAFKALGRMYPAPGRLESRSEYILE